MSSINEKQLIDRILSGRTEEYGYFLERYGREVFTVVARVVMQQEDAEEVTQDAFVKAFNHLSSFEGESSFSTWLCRIAYNEAINFLRKKRKYVISMDEDEHLLNEVSGEMVDEVLSTEKEESLVNLEKAINRLNPEDRMLVTSFYYEERSLKEIAYIMGVKEKDMPNAVNLLSTRLSRIRKKLYVLIKQIEHENE